MRNLSPIFLTHSKEYIFHPAELRGLVLLECKVKEVKDEEIEESEGGN